MTPDPTDTEAAFDEVVARFGGEPDVDEGTGFNNPGLKVGGKIFAMYVRGALVVKLSADRCAELVAAGAATPFEIGRRTMREWIVIDHARASEWGDLAGEALAFGRAAKPRR